MTSAAAPVARAAALPPDAGPWQRLGHAVAALTGWRRDATAVHAPGGESLATVDTVQGTILVFVKVN